MLWNIPLDDERTLSIEQFCEIEGLTLDQYRMLRLRGMGPVELVLARFHQHGPDVRRITLKQRAAWHERVEREGQLAAVFASGQEREDRELLSRDLQERERGRREAEEKAAKKAAKAAQAA